MFITGHAQNKIHQWDLGTDMHLIHQQNLTICISIS